MNNKLLLILTLVLAAGGVLACAPAAASLPALPTPTRLAQHVNVVSAEAFVVPVKEAKLSFEVGGRAAVLNVEEGDPVIKGQVLAQIDPTSYQSKVAEAQAVLKQAEVSLANTKAGPTPEEIAQAQATLDKAEAVLAQLIAGPTKEDIAQARAKVATAQAGLNKVLAGTRNEDLQAASARMLQTEATVRLAQADYDKFVYGDPKVAEPYGVALQKATLEYDAAKANYDKLVNGATSEDIGVARAGVAEAEAALAKVLAGVTPEQIAGAQADVAKAEAALAELKAGATQEQVAVAEAAVETAKAHVVTVETDLAKTQLIAPFAGVVGVIKVEEGEIVQPGTFTLSLGDTSNWQTKTDNLTEIDAVHVREGAKVHINVDALPNEKFEGQVVRITPQAETKAGDATYTVLIDITSGDTSHLRWGMTTFVDIEVGPGL